MSVMEQLKIYFMIHLFISIKEWSRRQFSNNGEVESGDCICISACKWCYQQLTNTNGKLHENGEQIIDGG